MLNICFQEKFNLSNAEATFIQSTRMQIFLNTIQALSCKYSLESSCRVLLDEYLFARVSVIFQVFCIILYWPNWPPAVQGLRRVYKVLGYTPLTCGECAI